MKYYNDPGYPKPRSRWIKGMKTATVWQYAVTPIPTFTIMGREDSEGGEQTEKLYYRLDEAEQDMMQDGWVKQG